MAPAAFKPLHGTEATAPAPAAARCRGGGAHPAAWRLSPLNEQLPGGASLTDWTHSVPAVCRTRGQHGRTCRAGGQRRPPVLDSGVRTREAPTPESHGQRCTVWSRTQTLTSPTWAGRGRVHEPHRPTRHVVTGRPGDQDRRGSRRADDGPRSEGWPLLLAVHGRGDRPSAVGGAESRTGPKTPVLQRS